MLVAVSLFYYVLERGVLSFGSWGYYYYYGMGRFGSGISDWGLDWDRLPRRGVGCWVIGVVSEILWTDMDTYTWVFKGGRSYTMNELDI